MFNVIAVIRPEDDPFPMFPVPTDTANEIELEVADGDDVIRHAVRGISVLHVQGADERSKGISVQNINATLTITDARVSVACSNYDKGGGWISTGAVTMAVLNAGSKVRAAYRRKNKMLVGHVRYPWVRHVFFTERTGTMAPAKIRITMLERDESGREVGHIVDLELPKGTRAGEIAAQIASRAARNRLATGGDLLSDVRTQLELLVDSPPIEFTKGPAVGYIIPGSVFVAPSTSGARMEGLQ